MWCSLLETNGYFKSKILKYCVSVVLGNDTLILCLEVVKNRHQKKKKNSSTFFHKGGIETLFQPKLLSKSSTVKPWNWKKWTDSLTLGSFFISINRSYTRTHIQTTTKTSLFYTNLYSLKWQFEKMNTLSQTLSEAQLSANRYPKS